MNKAFHKQHFYYGRADISFSTSGIKVFWYCLLFFVLSAGGAFAAGEPGTLKWSFKTGDRIDTSPAIASDGTVYAGSNGNLYAVNSNGTLKWSFKIDDNHSSYDNHSSPVIGSDGTVYVVSKKPDVFSTATLYAVTADGKMKWTFETYGYKVSAPVIGSDDTIYVESSYGYGYLYALNPDGTEKWSSEAADFWHRSSLAIDSQGTIYMGTGTPYDDRSEGALYTFNLDGTLKWSFKTGKTYGSYGSPISNPAIGSDSTIYIVRVYDGTLYALNPDGTLKWSYKLGSNYEEPSPVIGSDGTIYVGSNRNLYAVKPDGKLKWTFRIGDVGSTSPAIGSDGTVYVGAVDGNLYAVNSDGKLKWAFKTGNSIYSSPAIGSDGTVYVGSSDGTLYAIYSDSYGLAKSPWPMFRYNAKHTGQAGGAFYDSVILSLDQTYTGNISPSHIRNFSVNTEQNRSIVAEVIPNSASDQFIVDGKFGDKVPYPRIGDITTDQKTSKGSYEIVISPTEAGTYYFSVYGYKIAASGSTFSIKVRYADKHLSDVSPKKAGNKGSVSLTVSGLGFVNGVSIRLTQSGKPTLSAAETIITNGTELTARFNLNNAAVGIYDLTAVWPDNTTLTLIKAAELFQGKEGKFEADITLPDSVRVSRRYTAWLEYKNSGDADLPAPLLTLSANCPISLNKDEISQTTLQILAIGSGSMPGILRIGESVRIPIYFIAPNADNVQISIASAKDVGTAIDWAAQKSIMKPADMTDAEWNAIFPGLTTVLGNTWSKYLTVLRQDASLMKQRGYAEYDVTKYIRMEMDRAAGNSFAAISGILKHDETRKPLENVLLKFRSTSGDVIRTSTTAYNPLGYFIADNLPDGTYEVFPEGYYFDPPQTITISGQNDRNGMILYAKSFPEDEPEEPLQTPVRNPSLVSDGNGKLYLVFEREGEIWWAVNSGSGWSLYDKIPNAKGANPTIVYDGLLAGGTSPGLLCVWESPNTPTTLMGALGVPSSGGIGWSEPQQLTFDAYDDTAVLPVIMANHQPIILWLQKDSSKEDDTDLYYKSINVSNMPVVRRDAGNPEIAESEKTPRELQLCATISWPPKKKGITLPKWIPIIGGRHGISVSGSFCGVRGCTMSKSGTASVLVELGELGSLTGGFTGSAKYVTDKVFCQYILDEASGSLNAGGTLNFVKKKIPIFISAIPVGSATISGVGTGSAKGSLKWDYNFPSRPDAAVTVSVSGEGRGELEALTEVVSGGLSVGLSETWNVIGSAFVFKEYCVTIHGKYKALWGVLGSSFTKKWGSCVSGRSERSVLSETRRYKRSESRIEDDDVPVYEEMEIVKDTFTGTGMIYEGTPVLGNIGSDIYNDGKPSVARKNTGEMVLVWAKSFSSAELGAKIYAADWNGTGWSAPVEITPQVDFNNETAVIFDNAGNPMAVWSKASNAGLNYALNSVEEILNASEKTDIYYSQRIGGVWTAPKALASLTGKDERPVLFSSINNQIGATWLNHSGSTVTLYVSFWNGSSWSAPKAVSNAVYIEKAAFSSVNGILHAVWNQDSDGKINTTDDWQLFHATWNGSSWSDSAAITIEDDDTGVAAATRQVRNNNPRYSQPPIDCCKDEEKAQPPKPETEPIRHEQSRVVRSLDPNEKVAFGGVGDKNYINYGDRIRYIIYFENKATAAVPAQEVFITDDLLNTYDFSSLKVESVSFGNVIVSNPKNTAFFNTSVTIPDYRTGVSKQWKVNVITEFDPKTRRLKATFRTIDPETDDLPEDVNAGLLPPENGTGRGQGYIVFSVETAKDLSLGTVISNKASIVFDTNAPIETNTVFNTARYVADMNNDRDVTLADAIIALKVLAGLDQPDVNVGADVSGDGKIGLEEVVYILQIVAGLR